MHDSPSAAISPSTSLPRPLETSGRADSLAMFLLLPTVAMSLGWGLRGTIGGSQIGAMIPGAMVTLCLCLLLGWRNSVGIVAAIGTVAVGLGGQETYGQTIGFLREINTVGWGLTGLTIKGAAWGLSGGVLIGLGFVHSKYRWNEIAIGLGLMILGTWLGREFIDKPRYVYFSNPIDKPREEIWVGLILGSLALVLYLSALGRERVSRSFAFGGMLAGAIGFGGGSLFLAMGNRFPKPYSGWPWWKCMEFSFGALYGLGLGALAYIWRDELRQVDRSMDGTRRVDPLEVVPINFMIEIGLAVSLAVIQANFSWIKYRGAYSILGPILILHALQSNRLAWHIAMSATFCGFFRDFLDGGVERNWFGAEWNTGLNVALGTLAFVAVVVALDLRKSLTPAVALLLMSWVATPFGLAKMLISKNGKPLAELGPESFFVPAVFTVELILTTVLVLLIRSKRNSSEVSPQS